MSTMFRGPDIDRNEDLRRTAEVTALFPYEYHRTFDGIDVQWDHEGRSAGSAAIVPALSYRRCQNFTLIGVVTQYIKK